MGSKQVNMAAVVAASVAGAANAVQTAQASAASVTVKEAPVMVAIANSTFAANVKSLSKLKGVDEKSIPGIVASLNKKGLVAAEPSFMGTLYVATKEGAAQAKEYA
jgi:DNA-binding MarR family transcriptional regulator